MLKREKNELKLKVQAATRRSHAVGDCLLGLKADQVVSGTLSWEPGPGPQPEALCWIMPGVCHPSRRSLPTKGDPFTVKVRDLVRGQRELTRFLEKLQTQIDKY